jgi:cobalamin biosynthetic protein CobC
LLPLVMGLVPPGGAAVLTPGYGEFGRAAALAGHRVKAIRQLDECGDATLVVLGNPNNPDGRVFARNNLLALAASLRGRGALLVVDEAFADVAPEVSVAADVGCGNIVVLRSFGKFFGLAGLRLGFAVAAPPLAERLRAALGPWAVSGPALAVGTKALGDAAWSAQAPPRLDKAAAKLDGILSSANLEIVGGTSLFRLARAPAAHALFEHLGRSGLWVRTFADHPGWLRFGLPGEAKAWRRLQDALSTFRGAGVRQPK